MTSATKPVWRCHFRWCYHDAPHKHDPICEDIIKFEDSMQPKNYHHLLAQAIEEPTRCNTWMHPGDKSWGSKSNIPNECQCALDSMHEGDHAVVGNWASLSFQQPEQPEQVNHPNHYGGNTVYEVIKVLSAWGLGFLLGNTVKYVARAGKKDPTKLLEDLKKGRFYLDYAIQRLERGEPLF
jgi:hypothetical protein